MNTKIILLKIGEDYTIINKKYENEIAKNKWERFEGKIVNRDENNRFKIYLHEYVLKNCACKENENKYKSIEHINGCYLDNREENLRYIQGQTKHKLKELKEKNIEYLPEHITYIIKNKNPIFQYKNIEGKDEGSVSERYIDILNKAIKENEKCKENINILHKANKILNKQYFTPNYEDIYNKHKRILEMKEEIIMKEILHQDESMVLKKEMIPIYVTFIKENDKRGCKFTYDRKYAGVKISAQLSGSSKKRTLRDKYEEMKINYNNFVKNELEKKIKEINTKIIDK